MGVFHDQGEAKWIVIRGQLRGHNDTPCGRPTPWLAYRAYRRLRATQLLVILPLVLHRKGSKGPRKPIRGPYTNGPAHSQEQSTTSSRHFLRQTKPPKGGPETTSVIDNVSKHKKCPAPLFFFVFFFFSGTGGER
jgi:hypothetical protein